MDEKRRSTILALSCIAGALVLAILQVGLILTADAPRNGAFLAEERAAAPAATREQRETRFLPARSYPRS